MKQTSLVTILLIVIMLMGWLIVLTDDTATNENDEYKSYIALAEDYVERGLYQKAIQEYENAIELNDTEQLRTVLIETYEKRYEESTDIYSDYLSALESAVSKYPENVEYLISLTDLYLVKSNYSSAYKALNTAVTNGLKDESIAALLQEVQYAYSTDWASYTELRGCVNGYYAVCDAYGNWTYIDESGDESDFGDLVFAGSVGEDGIFVIQNETRAEIYDEDEVVQGILDFEPEDAGVYAEGLVAIKNDGVYSYYDVLGDFQFGEYDAAGTFVDGKAAVEQDGSWFLINTSGEAVSSDTYEDIVLLADGTYIQKKVMIAKKNGSYHLYIDGAETGSYEDADILTEDGLIAVCVDGKWGFVDTEGNEVIAPQYAAAKSFSNGLAAVSPDGETWGFINEDGTLVIEAVFLDADYFNSESSCMVEVEEDSWKLITLYIEQ